MRNGNENDNDNSDTETIEDPSVLWERLQESQRQQMELFKQEKEKLQKEKDTMDSIVASSNVSNDDIIEINTGGKIIEALRSTLTLAPDTMFSYMFSGRWEESLKRDTNGRVFLDHDPELIEIIVNHLRAKKIENQSKPVKSPKIPDGKKDKFESLLHYFGLTDFFYPTPDFLPFDISNIEVVQPHGSLVNVTKSENKIQFTKVNGIGHYFVACKQSLNASSEEGSFWKVTIDVLPNNQWVYLGIIGNLAASNSSCSNSTSYGWACSARTFHGGLHRNGDSGWTQFTQGECLYFQLKTNKLTMFSVQKNLKFVIDIATTCPAYYIHFDFHAVITKLTLEPLCDDERERLLDN
jgi:hypothetical protein